MTPFEVLYGKRRRILLCWYENGNSLVLSPKLFQQAIYKIKMIRK